MRADSSCAPSSAFSTSPTSSKEPTSDRRPPRHAVVVVEQADFDLLDDDDSFREELDLDSMDFLKFCQAVHARTGIDIPELDQPKLDSVEGALAYLEAKGVG